MMLTLAQAAAALPVSGTVSGPTEQSASPGVVAVRKAREDGWMIA